MGGIITGVAGLVGALKAGGPSTSMKQIAGTDQSLLDSAQAFYGQMYQGQVGLLNSLTQSLNPLVSAGPNQQGYSPSLLSALNSAAITTAGASYQNARQAAANMSAGQGGSGAISSGILSGVQQQIQAAQATGASNALSGQLNAITQNNYNIGRQNYWQALGAEQGLAQQYGAGASAEGGLAGNFSGSAWQTAAGVQQAKQQQYQDIGASIGQIGAGVVSAAIPFIAGGSDALGSGEGFGQGVQDFLAGGMNSAFGTNFNVSQGASPSAPGGWSGASS